MPKATITHLSHDGRGIAHIDGKITFIDGSLPDEEVEFSYTKKRGKFDEGKITQLIKASPFRTQPLCPHFSQCGGCSLQHFQTDNQITFKQQILLEHLQHFAGIKPQKILPPITGPVWGYRHKARLSVKHIPEKSDIMIGFHEKNGYLVTDLALCEILHPKIGHLLSDLKKLITQLKTYHSISQVEVAIGDDHAALVFRHLMDMEDCDRTLLSNFGKQHDIHIYLQPNLPKAIKKIWPENTPDHLTYLLPEHNLEMFFHPTHFTQVNPQVNQKLIQLAIEQLEPQPTDKILDLFCGLGNFTLPLAQLAASVVGIEGDSSLVKQAQTNAKHNKINNVEFYTSDLASDFTHAVWAKKTVDKILIDPPRTGAIEVIKYLTSLRAKRIVYVSCNSATLARDAKELVKQGYCLTQAGVVDMFPHTRHAEAIAVFNWKDKDFNGLSKKMEMD